MEYTNSTEALTDHEDDHFTILKAFDELYNLESVLAQGTYWNLQKGVRRSRRGSSNAIKCVKRDGLSRGDEKEALNEVKILQTLKNRYVIQLHDFFTEPHMHYIVLEKVRGGDLCTRISQKGGYSENNAMRTCKNMLTAIQYCHKNRIAHRDLKPENFMLVSVHDDTDIRLCNFGLAKKVKYPNSLLTICGVAEYAAPEVLEGCAYDQRADMWSLGVILYVMLVGYLPFSKDKEMVIGPDCSYEMIQNICDGEYEFHESHWKHISLEVKALISKLLNIHPEERLSASEALKHSCLPTGTMKQKFKGAVMALILLERLERQRLKTKSKQKLRAVVQAIMATNKLNFFSASKKQKMRETQKGMIKSNNDIGSVRKGSTSKKEFVGNGYQFLCLKRGAQRKTLAEI